MGPSQKRKAPENYESTPQNSKYSQKMDLEKIKNCLVLLKKLMNHPFGWVFNQPVNPVELNIPDYLTIITKPMDLGTIRQKLLGKKYIGTNHFYNDIKLTFDNAMVYNPPENEVHLMAKKLRDIFDSEWELLEEKWVKENPNLDKPVKKNPNLDRERKLNPNFDRERKINPNFDRERKLNPNFERGDKRKINPNSDRENPNLNKRAKPSEIVRKSDQGSLGASNKGEKSNGYTISGAQTDKGTYRRENANGLTINANSNTQRENANGRTINGINTEKRNYTRENANGCTSKIEKASYNNQSKNANGQTINGYNNQNNYSERNNIRNGISQTSTSCKKDIPSLRIKIKAPINGTTSKIDDNGRSNSNSLASTAPHNYEKEIKDILCTEQISPNRALRAAMLKSRFADTIVKAQQKTLLDHDKKMDPAQLRLEKAKIERLQLQERKKIEAAQEAARIKREKEREAARISLDKMKRTVELDNTELVREIEKFAKCAKKLDYLGLYLKCEYYFDGENLEEEDLEEGEII